MFDSTPASARSVEQPRALADEPNRIQKRGVFLDTVFYDEFFKPGAYLETHACHMERWHPEGTT